MAGEVAGSEIALGRNREREDGKTLKVAELWLRGFSLRKISVLTGLSKYKVHDLISKSKLIWRNRKDLALGDVIAEQLRRVDLAEMKAWEAWEKSHQDQVETRVYTTKEGIFKSRTTKSSSGDPRFIDIVLKCIEQRCKLLSVYKPPEERAELEVWGVTVVVDTPEQAEEILSYEQFGMMKLAAEDRD